MLTFTNNWWPIRPSSTQRLASLAAGLGTGIGAAFIYGISELKPRTEDALLSGAAGIMLAASRSKPVGEAFKVGLIDRFQYLGYRPLDYLVFQDSYPDDVSHCYGCGRLNPHGLQIKSYWEGEEAVCRYRPQPYHTAIPGYVYGGLIASLIDCHSTGTASAAARRSVPVGPSESRISSAPKARARANRFSS